MVVFEKCIKSLLDQSLKPEQFEIIFSLDGKDDGAVQVIKRLMKKFKGHSEILVNEHGGACSARNKGFEKATGDILVFWDCDCIIECHAASAWLDIFKEKKDIGFIYAGYKFFNPDAALNSEPFDPWMLRVTNYISGCFPIRRKFYPGWNESLKSLQDWDFWLSAVEKGAKGHFMIGYAFSTKYPTPESISGQGCTQEVWLDRMAAVKKLHNIPDKKVCVSAFSNRHEGIRLAKLLDADYMDQPTAKPHKYKTIIQIGFSFGADVETHSEVFNTPGIKNILFWDQNGVHEAYNKVSARALKEYSERLNKNVKQYCEDLGAQKILTSCGFDVEIMPVPYVNENKTEPMPEKPSLLVDIDGDYGAVFNSLEKSLPDVKLEVASDAQKIGNYNGFLYFHREPSLTASIKRMVLSGKYVLSNIRHPFTGFVNDHQPPDTFIPEIVEKIRDLVKKEPNERGRAYYEKLLSKEKLQGAIA
jgi:glycosyltransferase involved in cell wall biosynthesis